jgi:signal transduction histidine kinase
LILASGYLFNTFLIPAHILSFPGVFGENGVIGGGSQTTAWLYTIWHGGFACFVLAYALIRDEANPPADGIGRRIALAICAVLLLSLCLILFTTVGHDWLPIIVENNNYSMMVTKGLSPTMLALCVACVIALGRQKKMNVLDLWVGVVMVVWALEITMSAVLSSARYELGWYAGRLYGLFASTFVLCALLWENNKLYSNLNAALLLAAERQRDLIASRDELARVQRLESLGQLTGGIAHDFNNVLQVIAASLSLLRYKLSGNEEAKSLIDRSMVSVERGARLSSGLLSFARRQPLRPKVVDVSLLLNGMAEVLGRTLGNSIQIETSIPPGIWNTVADPAMLENAILNLSINARDAMQADGKLKLKLSVRNVHEKNFDFSQTDDVPPMPYVMISVTDNGAGIPADVLPRVFEPFFTTKPLSEGTGLGLSMVHGFAKQSSGHVAIQTELGRGTTISLFLPRSEESVSTRTVKPAQDSDGGYESILVVEDHPEVRAAAVNTLEMLGYKVSTAHDAQSALQLVESDERFDLLFTDVIMPGPVKTIDMVKRVRELNPDIVVLFTSGYIENALAPEELQGEDVHLLSKPYDLDKLAAKVRELLLMQVGA